MVIPKHCSVSESLVQHVLKCLLLNGWIEDAHGGNSYRYRCINYTVYCRVTAAVLAVASSWPPPPHYHVFISSLRSVLMSIMRYARQVRSQL
jgi:hypothetical protein